MTNVSVIIPTYNSERFIAESLESVLGQSYRDFEVIVIDDGSTDHTGEIVKKYERRNPACVRYLFQSNAGPGAARNTGIRNARGAYIAFLDADDVWLRDKLKRQMQALRDDPDTMLVYCDNYFVDIAGKPCEGYKREVELRGGFIAAHLFCHYFIMPSAVLMRKTCLERVGFFREDIRVGEDYDLFLKIAFEFRIALVREKLYRRRHVPESLSNRNWIINATNDIGILTEFVRRRPLFYASNLETVRDRLGSYYFNLGYYALRRGRNFLALKSLVASLRYRRYPKTFKCLLLCLMPYRYVRRLGAVLSLREHAAGETEPGGGT